MIQITCKGNSAICTRTERLTSGMVGLQCEFVFDGAWDGLAKTAVFTAGNEKRDVLLQGAICDVPPEVMRKPGYQLVIGVFGSNADGTLIIPTCYAMCGSIGLGADPSGEESTDPTLPVWGQLQGMIGNLDDLQTASKDNLVAAINEAAQSGGGGGASVELDTTLTQSGKAADAKAVGDALAEKQPKGDYLTQNDLQSATNAALEQAKASGEFDGTDGTTPHIGDNGNWYLGDTDTGKPSRGETGPQGPKGDTGAQGPQGDKGDKGDPGDTPDMTAYRTAEAQDVIDAGKQDTLIQSGASVGQIAKITAVDETGKPTEWEAADMASDWKLFQSGVTDGDVAGFEFEGISDYSEFLLLGSWAKGADNSGLSIQMNNTVVIKVGSYFVHVSQAKNVSVQISLMPQKRFSLIAMSQQQGSTEYNIDGLGDSSIYNMPSGITEPIEKIGFFCKNPDATVPAGATYALYVR